MAFILIFFRDNAELVGLIYLLTLRELLLMQNVCRLITLILSGLRNSKMALFGLRIRLSLSLCVIWIGHRLVHVSIYLFYFYKLF